MSGFQEENDTLLESILQRTFYAGWKEPENPKYMNFNSLEIIMNYKCNLGCAYCYVNRWGEELYPSELYADEEKLLSNLQMILQWMKRNNYRPEIEYFSGEALVQDVGLKGLEMIVDSVTEGSLILVPTNYTFILSDVLTERVDRIVATAKAKGVRVSLSASIDGKYCEVNRPFKGTITSQCEDPKRRWEYEYSGATDPRDDAYYEKVFAFAKKWSLGFHPMIYSNNIDKWKDNFLWFQEMYKKYDIPWSNLYLLEVRNAEWTDQQIRDYMEFIKFLVRWSLDMTGSVEGYINFVFKNKGFNILTGPLTTIGRGMGCSLQSAVYLRLGDLALVPCHRQSYKQFVIGWLKTEAGEITGVKAHNTEIMVAELSCTFRNFPYCEACPIKHICSGGCLGSQFESTGDPFTPIPGVCKLMHNKIRALIEVYKELGIYEPLLQRLPVDKREAFEYVEKVMEVK